MRVILVFAILATAYGMYFPRENGDIWVTADHPIQRNKIGGSYPPNWPSYRTGYKSASAQDPNFSCPDGTIKEGEPVPPRDVCRRARDDPETTYSCYRRRQIIIKQGVTEIELTYRCIQARRCANSTAVNGGCYDMTAIMRQEFTPFKETQVLGVFECCHQEADFDRLYDK